MKHLLQEMKKASLSAEDRSALESALAYADQKGWQIPADLASAGERAEFDAGQFTPEEARRFIQWHRARPLEASEQKLLSRVLTYEQEIRDDGVKIPASIERIFRKKNLEPQEVRDLLSWADRLGYRYS